MKVQFKDGRVGRRVALNPNLSLFHPVTWLLKFFLFTHIHSFMIPVYATQIPEMKMQGECELQKFGEQGQKFRIEN